MQCVFMHIRKAIDISYTAIFNNFEINLGLIENKFMTNIGE